MVWVAISYTSKINLAGIDGKIDSEHLINVSQNCTIANENRLMGEEYAFQPSSASVQTFAVTKQILENSNTCILDWTGSSPDLNIIENVWGQLSRNVCAVGCKFDKVSDLQDNIINAWESIDIGPHMDNILLSTIRLMAVVESKGKILSKC